MFFPVTGRPITAITSDEGKYSIGLSPGDYVVTVNPSTELPPGFKEGDPIPPQKFKLPDNYTVRTKSTLAASVKDGQTEPIDFTLK